MAYRPYIKNSNGTLTDIPLHAEISNKIGTSSVGSTSNPIYIDAGVPKQCSKIVDLVYPVGSIYMSTGSTSPASLFGGTWEQLKDRFLLGGGGSYALGGTGGASTHTLTTSEMPSHRHGLSSTNSGEWLDDYDWVKPLGNNGGGGANKSGAVAEMCINTGMGQRYVSSYSAAYSGYIMEAVGGGSAHNNMPPYLVVNMWKRVS